MRTTLPATLYLQDNSTTNVQEVTRVVAAHPNRQVLVLFARPIGPPCHPHPTKDIPKPSTRSWTVHEKVYAVPLPKVEKRLRFRTKMFWYTQFCKIVWCCFEIRSVSSTRILEVEASCPASKRAAKAAAQALATTIKRAAIEGCAKDPIWQRSLRWISITFDHPGTPLIDNWIWMASLKLKRELWCSS